MSGPKTDTTGQIVRKQGAPGADLAALIAKMGAEIARALPRHVTPDRMSRVVLTSLRTTPKLAECSPESFLGCVMQAAQLGLEPNTPLGHAYLIPRWSSKRKRQECTLLIGYQGYLDLARRSGAVDAIYAHAVREGDDFRYSLGTHPDIEHVPSGSAERESREITHAYAVAHLRGSSMPVFVVLSRAQIESRRARSETADASFSPWATDYEAMALKSAVRALWRWLPKSAELPAVDAIEDAHERARPISETLDPQIGEALARHGLMSPDTPAQDEPAAPAATTTTADSATVKDDPGRLSAEDEARIFSARTTKGS